ncbi:hypothetical protein pipiens_015443 [Culex pipiens pipiens]|uniref:Uncharacterized protein n=1 Tax=Culex pipiens pipiens TaxID=38569 RepID=A0ABD1CQH1_CULPP
MEPRRHRCSILGQTVPQIQPNDSARRQHLAEAVQTSGMEICMRIVFADERSPSGTQGLHRHLSSDDHHNTENFPGETTIKMYLLQHHVGYPAVHHVIPAIYLGACGFGLTIIPGLSYIHIRAPGRWRSIYMALCYFWFLTGVAGAATMYLIDVAIWTGNSTINETIHTNFSTCLLAGSCFVIVLLAINEMLQREGIHERNYIMSRQQHYQHHPRNSPEPQQYNYLPERQSEHPFQQRYNPEYDDRPRSNASQQQNRYTQGPPLLSRQQYYEQYSHDRTPPPIQPKPPSVRQTPTPPVDSQPTLAPLARRPQQSQTVKSEPGYVSRPRLETQKSEAPAPPPMPPADYLTKSLPRIKPDRPSRESIHPVLMLNAKPARPQEEIIPGVEYAHNLRPSEFLRQSRQLSQYRDSTMAI